jgi:hypothetical protein
VAPSGILEAAAALGVQALALAAMLSGSAAIAMLARDAWDVHAAMFRQRQVEHLLENASVQAGTGPGRPQAVAAGTATSVVLHGDANGNGTVDLSSAERTEVELRVATATKRNLFHHVGGQAMKVAEGLPAASRFSLLGIDGAQTDAVHATAFSAPTEGTTLIVAIAARLP